MADDMDSSNSVRRVIMERVELAYTNDTCPICGSEDMGVTHNYRHMMRTEECPECPYEDEWPIKKIIGAYVIMKADCILIYPEGGDND